MPIMRKNFRFGNEGRDAIGTTDWFPMLFGHFQELLWIPGTCASTELLVGVPFLVDDIFAGLDSRLRNMEFA